MRPLLTLLIASYLAVGFSVCAKADCVDDAADYHMVNPWILRAIAQQESRFNPKALNVNKNGTVDIGIDQINEVHFPTLARYGIKPTDLYDPCISNYTIAWLLHKKIVKYGNSWLAVGALHSETPKERDAYSTSIHHIIDVWTKQGIIK